MNKGNGFIGLIIIIAIIWGAYSLFKGEPEYSSDAYSNKETARSCYEPENPYNYGTGHYAGYEWGAQGKSCGGNSNSFIEGCEEFQSQEEDYELCLNN